MVVREKRDVPFRPVLLKLGVALAFSLGGILYTITKRKRNNKPPGSKPSQPSLGNRGIARRGSGELKDDDRLMQDLSLPRVTSSHSISDHSPSSRYSGDRDGFLLPEFNELVKECNMVVTTEVISPRTNDGGLVPDVESPREYRWAEHSEHEREIRNLRSKVEILQERERKLEIQLLEYYGLKEQETAVMELQNRLKLNNVEAKLYNLKITSLQSDKRRLESQLVDHAKVVTELEAAKAKIKVLKKKLRTEAEHNKEQILNLQEKVTKLHDENGREVDTQVQKRKEVEEELEEMKKLNDDLKLEKSELAQKLEYLQMLATSAIDNEEVLELQKESRRLRQKNEDLLKELEQLNADRCTDVEELVYLRWINACLRYELRNYQPGSGKTARDLSKTLSPKSEERAKQLILEYANKEGSGDKGISISDVDSDQWSSQSYLTDSGEPDDSSVDMSANKTNRSSKPKVFSKLIRLLRGKDIHRSRASPSSGRIERAVSMDELVMRSYSESIDAGASSTNTSRNSSSSSRLSLDLPKASSRGQKSTAGESSNCSGRASVDGSLSIYRRINSITEDDNDSVSGTKPFQDVQNLAKEELVKYAEALKKSRDKSSISRRSNSRSSC